MADLIATERSNIVAIADAVRNRTGESGDLTIGEIISGINSINGGAELPPLSNPATEDEVFLNQEYIDSNGNKKTGTFTIDSELSEQDNLINRLQTLAATKVTFNTIYIGTSAPTNDIGVDGDIYIVRSEA